LFDEIVHGVSKAKEERDSCVTNGKHLSGLLTLSSIICDDAAQIEAQLASVEHDGFQIFCSRKTVMTVSRLMDVKSSDIAKQ
jgi:hypothetical protein